MCISGNLKRLVCLCKIDDPCVLAYVTKVFGALAPNASLFAGGTSAYRRRGDHVLGRLGISVSMPSRGATPAVLRGSGATALYLESEDLSLIQWRGRWAQLKTVEHYIQEVAAQSRSDAARRPCGSQVICRYCWTAVAFFSG